MNLENKVAIVTGSSMGIGKSIAAELLAHGAKVVLNARNEQRLGQTQTEFQEQGFSTLAVAADISDPDDCERLIQETVATFGRVDILVNNAGISMEGEVETLAPAVVQKVFSVNTIGTMLVTQSALPYLQKTQGSAIFVSSLAGLHGIPSYSAYSASKMALTAIAQSLRAEVGDYGIHVGIAYLGFTENDPQKMILDAGGNPSPQPKRKGFRPQPARKVARQIVRMIKQRKDHRVFTPLGHFCNAVARIAPWFAKWCMLRTHRKSRAKLKSIAATPKFDQTVHTLQQEVIKGS